MINMNSHNKCGRNFKFEAVSWNDPPTESLCSRLAYARCEVILKTLAKNTAVLLI